MLAHGPAYTGRGTADHEDLSVESKKGQVQIKFRVIVRGPEGLAGAADRV